MADPNAVTGTTSLFGRCMSVGGAKPKAKLRLMSGDLLTLRVNKSTARDLARRLYDFVVLEGVAQWRADTMELLEFQVHRVTPYDDKTDPVTAFGALAEAAGGRWDGVDAGEFVHELRTGRTLT